MKRFDTKVGRSQMLMHRCGVLILVAGTLSIASVATAVAAPPPPPGGSASAPVDRTADDKVAAFALQWFTQVQAGKIDRSQYAAAYSTQLTDEAVRQMSHEINQYGASPLGATVLQSRVAGGQTLYVVKLVFPRGDAASLLLGLDVAGKITGIDIMSMAGD